MELTTAIRRAGAELGLAATIAVGSRTTRLRTLLTALGVGLGVVVLLLAASVPHANSAREKRENASAPQYARGHARLHLFAETTVFRGTTIVENAVQVTGGTAAVPSPPGIAQLPAPGQMVVSPAVLTLLRGPGGGELRRRLHARVVGVIGATGLPEPNSEILFLGSDRAIAMGAVGVTGFGGVSGAGAANPLITLLVIVTVVALLLPVAVFVATAARFGFEERGRRLAAMRLLGADRAMTARIAAGESLIGALLGLALGAAGFVVLAPVLAHAGIAGITAFDSDLRPVPGLAVLVAVLVPLCAVVATLVSIRRVAIEPLGVSARRTPRPRRLMWRIVVPAIGFALLAPLLVSRLSINSTPGQIDATAGVLLVLVGVTTLLPWTVETIIRRAPDGPLPWLLAIRRLRQEEGSTGRVIGAIGLAVAGAVALSVVFGAAQAHVRADATGSGGRTLLVSLTAPSRRVAEGDLAMLALASGVQRAFGSAVTRDGRDFLAEVQIQPSPSDPDAAGLRDAAAALDPVADVASAADTSEARELGDLRQALVGGALVVLAMIGASLLVSSGEGVRERRPALAVLAAVGTSRATVAWATLCQVAVPIVAGLTLAVGLGLALGAMLTAVVGVRLSYDWAAIALMLAAGAAVIGAVTGLTLPVLARAMRPEALRVE